MATVEDQYLDVLQNIEFGIVTVYRERAEMSDYAVMRMLEALIDRYTAEKIGRPPRDFGLSDVERVLLSNVRRICEWRLGRERPPDNWSNAEITAPEAKTADEIVLCLKRVLRSAKRWNKEAGRQGYLDFITQFVR